MEKTTNTLETLLENMGWLNLPEAKEAAAFFGNAPMTGPHLAVDRENGRVFVSCGGDALFGFYRADGIRGSAYVVLDDNDYRSWQWKRAQGKDFSEIGPCPDKTLRVAVTI